MLSLGCTNKFFAHIMSDDALWRRKLVIDYNFTGSETNRTSGWKFIYLRLGKPQLFCWGCVMFLFRYVTEASAFADVLTYSSNCFRTIYQPVPKKSPRAVLLDTPLPLETHLKNKRFVSLAASNELAQLHSDSIIQFSSLIVPVNQQVVTRT